VASLTPFVPFTRSDEAPTQCISGGSAHNPVRVVLSSSSDGFPSPTVPAGQVKQSRNRLGAQLGTGIALEDARNARHDISDAKFGPSARLTCDRMQGGSADEVHRVMQGLGEHCGRGFVGVMIQE
jgi:hypothetical protein